LGFDKNQGAAQPTLKAHQLMGCKPSLALEHMMHIAWTEARAHLYTRVESSVTENFGIDCTSNAALRDAAAHEM
jgi:hypothetical protein